MRPARSLPVRRAHPFPSLPPEPPVSKNRIERTYEGALRFGVLHKDLFALEGTANGLSEAQVTAFGSTFDAFEAARLRQLSLESQLRAATVATESTYRAYMRQSNSMLKSVDAYAAEAPDRAAAAQVYKNLQVEPPSPGSPTPPPAAPTETTARLEPTGAVVVGWKGSKAGIGFRVQRLLRHVDGTDTGWVLLPQTVGRPFTDFTVPAGTLEAQYQVQAWRGTRAGPWGEPAALRFTAGGSQPAALKIAA